MTTNIYKIYNLSDQYHELFYEQLSQELKKFMAYCKKRGIQPVISRRILMSMIEDTFFTEWH